MRDERLGHRAHGRTPYMDMDMDMDMDMGLSGWGLIG